MEFQLSYFKSWKMMLLKCCTYYASKFGKLSIGQETGKCPFSFQSQRKAMRNSVQTIIQLCSFNMLARSCLKSFKLRFSSVWTKNFQMYKRDYEKAEETEIKLPTFFGTWIKQENSRKTSTSASFTMLKPLTRGITTNCEKFLNKWEYQSTFPISWQTCRQVKRQQLEPDMEKLTSSKFEKEYDKDIYFHPAYLTCMQSPSCERPSWMNHKLKLRLSGEISTTSEMQMITTLMA